MRTHAVLTCGRVDNLRLRAGIVVPEQRAVEPRKLEKRRKHFVRVPWHWTEALKGAPGQTYALAHHLLYLHWKNNGAPIKLANGMLEIDGINRHAKWRALSELERRGLVVIERRRRRSPIVTLNLLQ
jgi:hypothetical protein